MNRCFVASSKAQWNVRMQSFIYLRSMIRLDERRMLWCLELKLYAESKAYGNLFKKLTKCGTESHHMKVKVAWLALITWLRNTHRESDTDKQNSDSMEACDKPTNRARCDKSCLKTRRTSRHTCTSSVQKVHVKCTLWKITHTFQKFRVNIHLFLFILKYRFVFKGRGTERERRDRRERARCFIQWHQQIELGGD